MMQELLYAMAGYAEQKIQSGLYGEPDARGGVKVMRATS